MAETVTNNSDAIQLEYLLKLAPDFSVLDIAEKYCLEHNPSSGNNQLNKLFYYNSSTSNVLTTFYRGIFKIKKELDDIIPTNKSLFYKTITKEGLGYTIVIGIDALSPIEFSLGEENTERAEVIGVAF